MGEEAAFDELYNRYSKRLLVYFYRMLGRNEEKAQDFLQDFFLKLIEKPHLFSSKNRFSSWVFTVASNMCKNEYRRLKVRNQVVNEKDLDFFSHPGENNFLEKISLKVSSKKFYLKNSPSSTSSNKVHFCYVFRKIFPLEKSVRFWNAVKEL